MTPPDPPPDLLRVAARMVWFKTPEETLAEPFLFLSHAMTCGTVDDLRVVRAHFTDDDLRRALRAAVPGVFDARSWAYWGTPSWASAPRRPCRRGACRTEPVCGGWRCGRTPRRRRCRRQNSPTYSGGTQRRRHRAHGGPWGRRDATSCGWAMSSSARRSRNRRTCIRSGGACSTYQLPLSRSRAQDRLHDAAPVGHTPARSRTMDTWREREHGRRKRTRRYGKPLRRRSTTG